MFAGICFRCPSTMNKINPKAPKLPNNHTKPRLLMSVFRRQVTLSINEPITISSLRCHFPLLYRLYMAIRPIAIQTYLFIGVSIMLPSEPHGKI
jgi:hypothetical protein